MKDYLRVEMFCYCCCVAVFTSAVQPLAPVAMFSYLRKMSTIYLRYLECQHGDIMVPVKPVKRTTVTTSDL